MPERKPRQRITFADRLAKLDGRIERLNALVVVLLKKRNQLVEQHRAKAESMLKEAGVE